MKEVTEDISRHARTRHWRASPRSHPSPTGTHRQGAAAASRAARGRRRWAPATARAAGAAARPAATSRAGRRRSPPYRARPPWRRGWAAWGRTRRSPGTPWAAAGRSSDALRAQGTVGSLAASRRNLDDPAPAHQRRRRIRRLWTIPSAEVGVLDWFRSGKETSSSAAGSRRGRLGTGLRWDVGRFRRIGGTHSSGSFLGRSEEKMELRWEWVTTWRPFFLILLLSRNEFINQELQ